MQLFKIKILILLLSTAHFSSSSSLIFYSSSDSDYNTIPPLRYLDLWSVQGHFGNFLGTPISPYHFITVNHIEAQKSINVNGVTYPVLTFYDDWGSNLRIYKIIGKFPKYIQLYEKNEEIGKNVMVFGRGVGRGGEILLNNELRGWEWNNVGGQIKWGENIVDAVSISYGGDALKMFFNPNKNLPDLCSLSIGDSGGGVFIQDDGVWKLAGINYAVDSIYGFNNLMGDEDIPFQGAIFNEKGLYKFDGQWWYEMKDKTSSGSYAVRVSSRSFWIKRMMEWTYPVVDLTLQSSDNLTGPYVDEPLVFNDINSQEVLIPLPLQTKFFRVSYKDRLKIKKIYVKENKLVIAYGRL